jgi:hypothetical protein
VSWTRLPILEPSARVAARSAKHDKLDVEIGEWLLSGPEGEIELFIRGLVGSGSTHAGTTEDLAPRWFNRPQGVQFNWRKLYFRGGGPGGRGRSNQPLLSGYLHFHGHRRADEYGPTRVRITAVLSLNPTRYVRHRGGSRREVHLDPLQWNWERPPEHLLSRTVSAQISDERVLDGSDNLLLDPVSHIAGRPEAWYRQVHAYWEAVWRLLNEEFTRVAAGPCNAMVRLQQRRVNLRSAEVYWEFGCEDALFFVRDATDTIATIGQSATTRTHAADGCTTTRQRNSLSHRVKLNNATELSVYAKTDRRVRFEVRYDLAKNSGVLGGRHTSSDLNDLIVWLERLSEDASIQVNEALAWLSRTMSGIEGHASAYRFLSELAALCDDEQEFDLVLSLLVNTGRISLGERDPLQSSVRRLLRREVLVRPVRHARCFAPHPRYRRALSQLRGDNPMRYSS